jgi:outer membrane receptor protein involved in Fe transport
VLSIPGLQPFPAPLGNLNTGLTFGDYKETAGYGNVTFYLRDNVDVTGGFRYSTQDQNYAQSAGITILVPTPYRALPEVSDNAKTYLATLRWRPTDHINTYLRAASGYRPGGPGVSQDPTAPQTFKADTVWNYEAGLKASSADYRFSTDIAVFHIDWKNVQIDRYDANGLPFTDNGGKAAVDGVELDLNARPLTGLNIGFNAGYTNARIKQADPRATAATGAAAGDQLPLNPKYTAAVLGDYSFLIASGTRASFGGTIKYQGEKHSSYPGSPSDPDVLIPAYTSMDLRAGINMGRVDIQLRCDNLFNKDGIGTISSYKVLGNPNSPTFISYIRPRTLSLSVGTSF